MEKGAEDLYDASRRGKVSGTSLNLISFGFTRFIRALLPQSFAATLLDDLLVLFDQSVAN